MTLRDLMKVIPEEYWDIAMIEIYIPIIKDGDNQISPLIEVEIDEISEHTRILLTPDTFN